MEQVLIDKDTYKIDSKNYYHTTYKKKQIILAGSLHKNNYHIVRLRHVIEGNSKEWSTFSINRNGVIYQHYNPKFYSDFMDNKEIDKHSISIVLENMGELFYDVIKDKHLSAIYHQECDEVNVYEKVWKGYRYWEKYTEEQFNSTLKLSEYLCDQYKIPLESIMFNIQHENAENFNGIATRSNYDVGYNDLNPSFDLKKFSNLLKYGEDEY